MIKYLEKEEDFKAIIKDGKWIVDFYAEWCGPCKVIEPIIDELESQVEGLEVVKIDTDRFLSIAREQHVITVPNLKIFSNGKLVKETTGIKTKEELINFVSE